jgi:hypothetical protein
MVTIAEYSLCSLPASMQTAVCLSIVSAHCLRTLMVEPGVTLAARVHAVLADLVHVPEVSVRCARVHMPLVNCTAHSARVC